MVGNFTPAWKPYRQVCDDLALRLGRVGWTVHTTSLRGNRIARIVDMVTTAWNRRNDYAVAHVDVFSGLAFTWAEATCSALRRARKPYALTLHGGNLPEFARRRGRRVSRLLRSAGVVTAPSGYLLQQMQPYRDDPIVLLPNPLDLGTYPFRPRDRPSARIVWLRAFHEIYNPTMAPRVLGSIIREHPDARLTMVGPCKTQKILDLTREVATDLGIAERVTITGGVPKTEIPGHLAQGDVFLNTANFDNTPISVLEAMACGLCVVSTNVGGVPFLLEHEVDSLLVPPGDVEAMTGAVRRLLVEPGLAARISRNARAKVEAFDWSRVLPRWDSLLLDLAGGRN